MVLLVLVHKKIAKEKSEETLKRYEEEKTSLINK